MKVCVQGLWHLGAVTAACLAKAGHCVVGLDFDAHNVGNLSNGKAPIFEPGLDELISDGIASGKLSFDTDPVGALIDADLLWVAYDTPVDDEDRADVDYVINRVQSVLPYLADGAVVLVSSQMPVGSVRKLEARAKQILGDKKLGFACSPENLRLGKALDAFLNPDRVVVGVRAETHRFVLQELLAPVTEKVEWMSVESAEMTKHAINSFLAVSITFTNEIAAICELVGADAKEVERGLRTESRIGPRAYVSPGGPFAGGTLARDIAFLGAESGSHKLATPLLSAIRPSNDEHKNWIRRKFLLEFGSLKDVTVALWGLTYKVGTDTLRRSHAVELCEWLLEQGAKVRVFDPVVKRLPERWSGVVAHCSDEMHTIQGAHALVIGAEWPQFINSAADLIEIAEPGLVIIDANRHLKEHIAALKLAHVRYFAVGTPSESGWQ